MVMAVVAEPQPFPGTPFLLGSSNWLKLGHTEDLLFLESWGAKKARTVLQNQFC